MIMPKPSIARLSLYGAVGLIVLLLIFAFAGRDNLFKFLNDPRLPFQTYIPPAAPDYAINDAWAMPPVGAGDAQTPQIFVVTPTLYWGGEHWNTPLNAAKPAHRLRREAIPNWAGPFHNIGTIAIPLYRAASLFSFLTVRNDARGARKLAYQDVLSAFDAFLAQTNMDAPLILVGAEQGGLHVLGLLQDRFNDPYLHERLAAAYVIDFAVPLDLFGGILGKLTPCADKDAARCVVAYGAFRANETAQIKRFRERTMIWDENGRLSLTAGRALTCVNPILGGTTTRYAPKNLHRGGVAATGLEWGSNPAPLPAQTSAQCMDGVLQIDQPTSSSLRKKLQFGGRFKPDPFNLFYADLAEDAKQRVQNLQALFKTEGRLAPPFGDMLEILDAPIQTIPDN